jgi:hypothetical protein
LDPVADEVAIAVCSAGLSKPQAAEPLGNVTVSHG